MDFLITSHDFKEVRFLCWIQCHYLSLKSLYVWLLPEIAYYYIIIGPCTSVLSELVVTFSASTYFDLQTCDDKQCHEALLSVTSPVPTAAHTDHRSWWCTSFFLHWHFHYQVLSLDVTPGGLAVSSDSEGKLKVWTTTNGEIRVGRQNPSWQKTYWSEPNIVLQQDSEANPVAPCRFVFISQRDLEGHYGDVYSCRFFPSGVVVLSGGSDMQLKIWSAESGKCAATLTGHHAGLYYKQS